MMVIMMFLVIMTTTTVLVVAKATMGVVVVVMMMMMVVVVMLRMIVVVSIHVSFSYRSAVPHDGGKLDSSSEKFRDVAPSAGRVPPHLPDGTLGQPEGRPAQERPELLAVGSGCGLSNATGDCSG